MKMDRVMRWFTQHVCEFYVLWHIWSVDWCVHFSDYYWANHLFMHFIVYILGACVHFALFHIALLPSHSVWSCLVRTVFTPFPLHFATQDCVFFSWFWFQLLKQSAVAFRNFRFTDKRNHFGVFGKFIVLDSLQSLLPTDTVYFIDEKNAKIWFFFDEPTQSCVARCDPCLLSVHTKTRNIAAVVIYLSSVLLSSSCVRVSRTTLGRSI